MGNDSQPSDAFKPLEIRCTSAECESNLHCFMPDRRMRILDQSGKCRYCGAELVDWGRVHERLRENIPYVFQCLKYEMFRHYMWHVEIDRWAVNYARRKGTVGLRTAAEHRIRKYLGPAEPAFDGRQTPREGSRNPICYAQHATGTCCRKCAEYWHAVPQGRELTGEEVGYFVELIMLYIVERLPPLTQTGERVPPVREPGG
jgi:hypothetical protein